MPKRITYLEKRDGMPEADFRDYWSTRHADIARELPGVTAYRQNHVRHPASEPLSGKRYSIDGVVELWFTDEEAAAAGFASDVADRLILDEPNFLSGLSGGPVAAGGLYGPWPHKLWLFARWRDGVEADPDAVETWASNLAAELDGAMGAATNLLIPGAPLLRREALRFEENLPEVAVAVGFPDRASAEAALVHVVARLERIADLLARTQVSLTEEVVIV